MKEDCATSMSAQQGCNDDKAVVESFKDALKQRIGADHFRMWFSQGVTYSYLYDEVLPEPVGPSPLDTPAVGQTPQMCVLVRGQFALDRIRKNFLRPLRAAAHVACGTGASCLLQLAESEAVQAELPLDVPSDPVSVIVDRPSPPKADRPSPKSNSATRSGAAPGRRRGRRSARTLASLITEGKAGSKGRVDQPSLLDDAKRNEPPRSRPAVRVSESKRPEEPTEETSTEKMSASTFIPGTCNRLAFTAMEMVSQSPATASPLFLCGPSGTGKTHLLKAIAAQFRRRHRMRRVIQLSSEQFTNDFISSVGNSGIASFRRRYREVDALLIDDVQFMGAKRATLRELLYTVETLAAEGRPMVFAGNQSPTEIPGLTRELAGRMAAGLLCPIQPLDQATRLTILRTTLAERCEFEVPDSIITTINEMLIGDGRVIHGVANLINTLQRMYSRMPTMDEIRQFGGDLLRASKPVATLISIEQAVCQTFQLPDQALRESSQTRALSEPRMLAMYLSRQMTAAAFAEIGGHFGGRSHSTAITAGKNVTGWLESGKTIGRGQCQLTAQEAIDRIETLLRSG